MTQRGFKIGFRLLLAFLTWLSLAPASANAVICIGADGHIAVEAAHLAGVHGTEAVDHEPAAHRGVTLALQGQDHAKPCLDLTAPPGAAAAKAVAKLSGPANAAALAPGTVAAPIRVRLPAAPPPPATAPPSPHLTFLETVILRI